MDDLERATLDYLRSLGLGEPVFEPCGPGTFPDFLIDGETVVEATRLVRSPHATGEKSVDAQLPPFLQSIDNALRRIIREGVTERFFIGLNFRNSELRKDYPQKIRKVLSQIPIHPGSVPSSIWIDRDLQVDFIPASPDTNFLFRLGMVSGGFSSGWLVSDLLEHCAYAIARKQDKLENANYANAWLAVASHLTSGLSDHSFEEFSTMFSIESPFSRLILIDLNDPKRTRSLDI